jgi:hypothetical protein
MSGNLGLGEPIERGEVLKDISVAARIFDKNRWDDIPEDVAYVLARTAEGGEAKMKVRILVQHGSGACDIEARTMKPQDLTGTVNRILLFIEGELVADNAFNQHLGPEHRLAVQMRIVGVPEEGIVGV